MTVWLQIWAIFMHGFLSQALPFPGPGASAAAPPISLVNFTFMGNTAGNTATSAAVNMTGANLLVMITAYYHNGNACAPGNIESDSSGNTWVGSQNGFTLSDSGYSVCAWTVENPTVSASQTFNCAAQYPACVVMGFKNLKSSGMIDTGVGNGLSSTGTTITQSTLTPTKTNELCVAGTGNASNALSGSFAFPGGSYTPVKSYIFSNSMTVGAAYWVQTTKTATAPVWSDTGAPAAYWVAAGICFFSPNSI